MSSIKKNIALKPFMVKKSVKIGIVQSEYNSLITNVLLESCLAELKKSGVESKNIILQKVPGAWEIPIACQSLAKKNKLDVLITLGLILKGQTPHFDIIATACAQGIMEVSLKLDLPIIFGVLTTTTLAQAKARIKGGAHGDKGIEAAQAALRMI